MDMEVKKTYKFRIYPSESQISRLENTFSMCRYLYNWNLIEKKSIYENQKISLTAYDLNKKLPELKSNKPHYKSIHSQVLQDVNFRLEDAFDRFFNKQNEYPKFKKKGDWKSIKYPQYNDNIKYDDNGNIIGVFVSKISKNKNDLIKIKYHREIPHEEKIKTMIIKKDGGRWFVCFSIERTIQLELKQNSSSSIGIDLGLDSFIYDSEGDFVDAPQFLRKSELKLKSLQKKFSNCKRYSKKWYNLLKSIQKLHFKIKCQREDFLHKLSNKLLEKFDYICYEDLSIKNMIKNGFSGLRKSIHDAGWGRFIEILKYKSSWLGNQLIGINPAFTSQICSNCGAIVKKSLSIRTHNCDCGLVINRDYNAAINIKTIGMNSLGLCP